MYPFHRQARMVDNPSLSQLLLIKQYLAEFLDYGFYHGACPLAFRIWFSRSPSKVGCLLSC